MKGVLLLSALALLGAGKSSRKRPDAGASDGGVSQAAALARPVEVSSERLEILGKENRAIYSGNAKAVRDTTTITCDTLVVSYTARQEVTRIDAEGRVKVLDGDRMAKGDQATFDNTTGVVTLTGSPEAFQGGSHVSGSKVTFISGSDLIEVEDAKTLVEEQQGPQASPPVRIDAARLRIFRKKNEAVWTGNVKARRGTTDLTGARVVALYAPDGQLTHLEAHGGAEARDGDRWARGDRADFDPKAGVLVVTGNPEARQGQNRMKGTRITFHVGTDRLEVEHPTAILHPEQRK